MAQNSGVPAPAMEDATTLSRITPMMEDPIPEPATTQRGATMDGDPLLEGPVPAQISTELND